MAEFVENLDRINILGDESPGALWRYKTDGGNSTDVRIFDDPDIIINYTVWADIESLKAYTYQSAHVEFLRRRREWFVALSDWPVIVLWWVASGERPALGEAKRRLEMLRDEGPTSNAFTFRDSFPAPS